MIDFIKEKIGNNSLHEARENKSLLDYFTKSGVQKNVNNEYIKAYAERKFSTNDNFLNWVKIVMKESNFLSFFRYYRNPNASAKLIDSKIRHHLNRVHYSDNSYFNYYIKGEKKKEIEELGDKLSKKWLELLLFHPNDLLVHDYDEEGKPHRYLLEVEKVVAIESEREAISKVAFTAMLGEITGYVYIDKERYAFIKAENFEVIENNAHDLSYCPVTFISPEIMSDVFEVRKSVFTYVRPDLEEYVFLKTLQKMTEPNGAIPITVKLKTKENKKDNQGAAKKTGEHLGSNALSSQESDKVRATAGVEGSGDVTQAGTIVSVEPTKTPQGMKSADLVQNFLKFHYMPVEAMTFLNNRIAQIENNIISSVVGDFKEENESAKNELQVSKGYISKEDRLRDLSKQMSETRSFSDKTILSMSYNEESVYVNIFYGSDFFLQGTMELYEMFEKSPNPIERSNILHRLSRTRNMFNPEKAHREKILYEILPYSSDTDFDKAREALSVSSREFVLQTKFDFWIAKFESEYGDIVSFWENTEAEDSEKIIIITNLIYLLIDNSLKNEQKTSSTPKGVQGSEA